MGTWLFCLTAGGMLAVLGMCRPDQIADRFLRLIGILTFALLSGVAAWFLYTRGWQSDGWTPLAGALTVLAALPPAALIWLAPGAQRHTLAFTILCVVGALLALTAGCFWTAGSADLSAAGRFGWPATVIGHVSGALLMGSVTLAWLLGHAYLTATKMTIAPLRRLAWIVAAAVAFRFSFGLVSLALATWGSANPTIIAQLGNAWLILTLRAALGLVFPAVFAYMVLDCVKLRATQSATGILYFMSLFVYVGELSSQHLLTQLGWPI
ncbi:MAG: hypothetical protein ACE5GE_14705 [Phycisphaerae bacterium]